MSMEQRSKETKSFPKKSKEYKHLTTAQIEASISSRPLTCFRNIGESSSLEKCIVKLRPFPPPQNQSSSTPPPHTPMRSMSPPISKIEHPQHDFELPRIPNSSPLPRIRSSPPNPAIFVTIRERFHPRAHAMRFPSLGNPKIHQKSRGKRAKNGETRGFEMGNGFDLRDLRGLSRGIGRGIPREREKGEKPKERGQKQKNKKKELNKKEKLFLRNY